MTAAEVGPTTINPTPPPGLTIPACVPTDDPDWFRMVEECADTCHHPVHGLGHPERLRHLIPTRDAQVYAHEPISEAHAAFVERYLQPPGTQR